MMTTTRLSFSPYHEAPVKLPRWVNLDNHRVKDTWSGKIVRVTYSPKHTELQQAIKAQQVTDALNRIYKEPRA